MTSKSERSKQLRKVQTLEYLNVVANELMATGYNLNEKLLEVYSLIHEETSSKEQHRYPGHRTTLPAQAR